MDSAEFEEKYYKYKDVLFRIIFTYVKNVDDAEDILQDVFIKLYEHNYYFETDEHEKRWLIRVAVNQSKNHLKLFWNKKEIYLTMIYPISLYNILNSRAKYCSRY